MSRTNLIVNYLPLEVDDLSLKVLFINFGEIVQAKVIRDKATGKSLAYGFVKFLDEDDAYRAMSEMNGILMGKKFLKVSFARASSEDIRNCKLFITNLPKNYKEADVNALFQRFGQIIECRVLKDRKSGNYKGVAFVQFNVKAEANKALSLNGISLDGSDRALSVKFAEDQHKKKALAANQQYVNKTNYFQPTLNETLSLSGVPSLFQNTQPTSPYYPYIMNYSTASSPAVLGSWYGQMQQQYMYSNYGVPYVQLPSTTYSIPSKTDLTILSIEGLPSDADAGSLRDFFTVYGKVVGVYLNSKSGNARELIKAVIQIEGIPSERHILEPLSRGLMYNNYPLQVKVAFSSSMI